MRITKASIRARIAELQSQGVDIHIDSANGQYRFENKRGEYLSLRLPPGQLDIWLDGFETGQRLLTAKIRNSILDKLMAGEILIGDGDRSSPSC